MQYLSQLSPPLPPPPVFPSQLQKDERAAAALSTRSVRTLPGLHLPHSLPSSPLWSSDPLISIASRQSEETWMPSGCRLSSRRSSTHPVSHCVCVCLCEGISIRVFIFSPIYFTLHLFYLHLVNYVQHFLFHIKTIEARTRCRHFKCVSEVQTEVHAGIQIITFDLRETRSPLYEILY